MKLLITGEHSFLGNSVKEWLAAWPERYEVETVSLRGNWEKLDFSGYDSVLHATGIAHADTGAVTTEQKAAYYRINSDLTRAVAQKAKQSGVKQFLFLSSLIVYGEHGDWKKKRVIRADTKPAPTSVYGDSKLRAERGLFALEDPKFRVAILRLPMVYGTGCKGNYPRLAKLAKWAPFFPAVPNERSMLHKDHLCAFLQLLLDYGDRGLFFPQNRETMGTSQLVQEIARVHGRKLRLSPSLRPLVYWLGDQPGKMGGLVRKAWGSIVYDPALSRYEKGEYAFREGAAAIRITEQGNRKGERR